jgi:hypothetical protein
LIGLMQRRDGNQLSAIETHQCSVHKLFDAHPCAWPLARQPGRRRPSARARAAAPATDTAQKLWSHRFSPQRCPTPGASTAPS